MRVTVMASSGGTSTNLVAVDNVIIKMVSNNTGNSSLSEEPETEVQEKVRKYTERCTQ